MSYSIYYDRAFIRVGDKVIPLANSGSNNCSEFFNGREVPEKNWNVMNWQYDYQFLFTESELKVLARIYDEYNQDNGMIHKSRSNCFGPGELESWIMNGIKHAHTVEEYVSFGNIFFVTDYSAGIEKECKRLPFKTTDELLRILEELKDTRHKDIKIQNNRAVIRPVIHQATKAINPMELTGYFVLKAIYDDREVFFMRLVKRGVKFVYKPKDGAKIFKTGSQAQNYISKYENRLRNSRIFFAPEYIMNEDMVDVS